MDIFGGWWGNGIIRLDQMLDSLDISPRTNGRAAKAVPATIVRDLRPSDLALLGVERHTQAPSIKKLRDRHHALARALASGMRDHEAAAITGYSISRISILKGDPTFQELLSGYKTHGQEVFADFVTRASGLAIEAVNELHERLEDEPGSFTHGQLLEVVKTVADRSGNSPVQRSVNVSTNLDLSSRLASARRRLASVPAGNEVAEIPVIEGEFSEVEES